MPQANVAYSAPPSNFAALSAGFGVDDMRALLQRKRPASTAEALRLLREAFPASPLRLRIAACGG